MSDDIDTVFQRNLHCPDFVVNGIHYGRGDSYANQAENINLRHVTDSVTCWKINGEELEEIGEEEKNHFYSNNTYIVEWAVTTIENERTTGDQNRVYFHWKGEEAGKGYSPLPESVELENPAVERIVQWSEPAAFLRLFSGGLVVHSRVRNGPPGDLHLYLLRGEEESELHLYEVPLKRESLRSRTCFALVDGKRTIVWHGSQSSDHSRASIKKIVRKSFGANVTEVVETEESAFFREILPLQDDGTSVAKALDYTPKLFYFTDVTGSLLAVEVENALKSSHATPLPFLQTHLYSAIQPATFLLDDLETIWIWQGWDYDSQDEGFKTDCFTKSVEYAREQSNSLRKLVKLQKVMAGFEPVEFMNLFPVWKIQKEVVDLQVKDGITDHVNPLIELISHDDNT